jgi:DNA polymerase-3 subunit delta'
VLDNLVGNNAIKEAFRRMLSNQRVPNALIFAGEAGVGKRLFALELAKAVLCRNPQSGEACDRCASCIRVVKFPKFPPHDSDHRDEYQKIFWSDHTDVGTVLPYKNNILVDAIRDLVEQANFNPYEGAARFFLIDDADKLNASNDSAANALLKTLEEPPATSHLILLTARPNSLLPTIRSRCQIVRFAPLLPEEIETHLLANSKFSPNDVKLVSRLARGSLGRALSLDLETYKQQREMMLGALDALAVSKDRARLLKIAEELNEVKLKDEYEARLEVLQTLIHDVWTLRLGAVENLVNFDLQSKLVRFAEATESNRAQTWLQEIENLRETFIVNVNRKIATDALFMKMANA